MMSSRQNSFIKASFLILFRFLQVIKILLKMKKRKKIELWYLQSSNFFFDHQNQECYFIVI